ncbi:MAG TPA: uroporphyrinogen-III synthase [Tabrizicola sp.]|nr:uroporphyrinogen-III synthase [Tabrizicola sp.]
MREGFGAGNTLDMAIQSAPVLVTRPRAEAEAFAASLQARFGDRIRSVVAPLLAPRFLTPVIPESGYAAVIFTSAQAVEAALRLNHPFPRLAWCVGRKTAEVARAAGFSARSAEGDAETLAKAILRDPPRGRVLYLRGVDTRGNLLEILHNSGVATDDAIVYEQQQQPLTQEAVSLLRAPLDTIVPLFSPRTATLFLASLPADLRARVHFAAMSASVAEPLHATFHVQLVVARHPDAPSMLDAVETLLARWPVP